MSNNKLIFDNFKNLIFQASGVSEDDLKDCDYTTFTLEDYVFSIDPDLHKIHLYSVLKAARIDRPSTV